MERCPVCRAKVREQSSCRRCRADLTALLTLENRADYMLVESVRFLINGNLPQARRFCAQAGHLHRTEFSEILSGFLREQEKRSIA